MKFHYAIGFGLILVLAAAIPASANNIAGSSGDVFTIWFNEQGYGEYSLNYGPITSDPGTMMLDPVSGMMALAYSLPEYVTEGDVRIFEPNGIDLSDILRFETIGSDYYMFYFSADVSEHLLADTGLPLPPSFPSPPPYGSPYNDNGGAIEAVDGSFVYAPYGMGNNIYYGSEVPEPCTLLLLAVSLSGLAIAGSRKIK